MSAFDKAKDVKDKVQDVTEEQVDKLGDLIDKGADKVDEKTGGKYSDKIDRVVDAIQDPADAGTRTEEPPSRSAPKTTSRSRSRPAHAAQEPCRRTSHRSR